MLYKWLEGVILLNGLLLLMVLSWLLKVRRGRGRGLEEDKGGIIVALCVCLSDWPTDWLNEWLHTGLKISECPMRHTLQMMCHRHRNIARLSFALMKYYCIYLWRHPLRWSCCCRSILWHWSHRSSCWLCSGLKTWKDARIQDRTLRWWLL